MNVLEARGLTHSVRVQHRVEWEREHSKYMEQKQKEEDAIWETRSPILSGVFAPAPTTARARMYSGRF